MRKITLGILAHVDSGKTTLSEALLYLTGKIRKMGRVDHKDAYLDTFQMERERGITIFSKQAVFTYKDVEITLLDTPGHVDFSTEMERALQVLDYAILVVSGNEGVQGHTKTLWKLLAGYQIPTFLFVNKMDMPNVSEAFTMHEIKEQLGDNIVRFPQTVGTLDDIAMCDEDVLESYMETGKIGTETISNLLYERKIFPCYFGSALKLVGIEELLDGICNFTFEKIYHHEFGAKVFKISKDKNGNRLTHMKVTGGMLRVREVVSGVSDGERWEEKVNEIRIYSGEKYEAVAKAKPGDICAVLGLGKTYSGEGLGFEMESEAPSLQPVFAYKIELPEGVNVNQAYARIKELEEEDPTLQLKWNEEKQEITANVMGPIQIQVLKQLIRERFHIEAEFGAGSILYKETIQDKVEGIGHFEPLRHYAEVHLLLEPAAPGSGITLDTNVSENVLAKNWQRLILTHLAEKEHCGVLTGSPITDIHITVIGGKAHLKHTEGGDFRQSTYRAVRQGLKKAESVLLEPYYDFTLTVPSGNVGRAMTDISKMEGHINAPQPKGEETILTGYAPVSEMWNYIDTVQEYTHGQGSLTLKLKGYAPCHNAKEVIEEIGYDSESDVQNPTGSVFCAQGSGFYVPWDEVEDYMHVKAQTNKNTMDAIQELSVETATAGRNQNAYNTYASDKELEEIFEKTFGPVQRKKYTEKRVRTYQPERKRNKGKSNETNLPECVLVDGYNIIFAWEELKKIAADNIDGARDRLLDILSNYQGYKGNTVIVVFDAYHVKRHTETIYKHNNIYVIFTKEAETADMYIAKATHKMANKYRVTVATSDALEQLIIMGHGALRMSARNFYEEVTAVEKEIGKKIESKSKLDHYVIREQSYSKEDRN